MIYSIHHTLFSIPHLIILAYRLQPNFTTVFIQPSTTEEVGYTVKKVNLFYSVYSVKYRLLVMVVKILLNVYLLYAYGNDDIRAEKSNGHDDLFHSLETTTTFKQHLTVYTV